MRVFDLLTIFPQIFNSYFSESILKRAQDKKKIRINIHNIRDYALDTHKTVDDRPYGGGAGMVMKIEPIFEALKYVVGEEELKMRIKGDAKLSQGSTRIIVTDPDGKMFTQYDAMRLSQYENLVILCGHYEGIDARMEKIADEKISIGNYVLTGGELPAMIIIDAVARLLPGVLGNPESLANMPSYDNKNRRKSYFDYPHYTRPEIFNLDGQIKWRVPKVLLSGDHEKVKEWRRKHLYK